MRSSLVTEISTSDLTIQYIEERPFVKACLKKGLLNYSALSRMISKELSIEKTSSKDAIIVACRRYKANIDKQKDNDKSIKLLLSSSETEIKNKMIVFVIEKMLNLELVDQIQKVVRKEAGTFYFIEGSGSYTIVTQEKYSQIVNSKLKNYIIKQTTGLSFINFKSPLEIEHTLGVLSFLSSLFSESGINILEIISCWTDTIFVIETKDLNKAINLLNF